METVKDSGVTPVSQETYLRKLFCEASGGDKAAFEKLDSIAAGRNDLPLAKELFLELENKT